MQHNEITSLNHTPFTWEFPDQATREAYVSINPLYDQWKMALQLDTMKMWVLVNPNTMTQKQIETYIPPDFSAYAIMTNALAGAYVTNGGYRVVSNVSAGVANSNIGVTSGKYYFEMTATNNRQTYIGVSRAPCTQNYSSALGVQLGNANFISTVAGWTGTYGVSRYYPNQTVGVALDLEDQKVHYYFDNVFGQTVDISNRQGNTIYVAVYDSATKDGISETFNLRFRPEQMTYAPPPKFPAGFGTYA